MAQLSIEPLAEFYDEPYPMCETRGCEAVSEVRVEQTHQDDGEFWALCIEHAVGCVIDNIEWVAGGGDSHDEVSP